MASLTPISCSRKRRDLTRELRKAVKRGDKRTAIELLNDHSIRLRYYKLSARGQSSVFHLTQDLQVWEAAMRRIERKEPNDRKRALILDDPPYSYIEEPDAFVDAVRLWLRYLPHWIVDDIETWREFQLAAGWPAVEYAVRQFLKPAQMGQLLSAIIHDDGFFVEPGDAFKFCRILYMAMPRPVHTPVSDNTPATAGISQ
jgi:hypothetical protein